MLDLNQISLFVDVVKAGSFVGAARSLGLPPNSVSRKITQLERAIESRLLHRSTRKLALTAAGRALFDRCADPIAKIKGAGRELAEESALPSGSIRVAAPSGFFDQFPLDWIAEFLAEHPKIRIDFLLDDAKTNLVAESIDVAFRAGHLLEENSIALKLFATRFSLVASPSYLSARGVPRDVRSLDAHDCLLQSDRSGPMIWRLEGPNGQEEVRVAGRFAANTAQVVLKAAVSGLGIALLPERIAAADIAAGRLVRILCAHAREGGDLYAVFASGRQIPRAASAFVEFAARKLRRD